MGATRSLGDGDHLFQQTGRVGGIVLYGGEFGNKFRWNIYYQWFDLI